MGRLSVKPEENQSVISFIRGFPARRILLALLIATAGVMVPEFGRATQSLNVSDAITLALVQNPDLLAARQELQSAQARLTKAQYWNQFNPKIEGGATQARFNFAPGGSATQPSGSASLEVEVAGQRGKRIDEAKQNQAEAEAHVADAERLTRARTKYAFYQALYLRRRLDLTRKIEELNRKLRDASMARFHSGEAPKLEANLAAVRYDQARKLTLLARRDYENGLRALQRILGTTPNGDLQPEGTLAVHAIEVDPQDLVRIAIQHRPDLRARDYEMKRVEAEIALTKRLIIPNPTINGFLSQQADAPGQTIRVLGGSVGISIPLFDHKQAELAALRGERSRASYNHTATMLTVEQEVRDEVAAYDSAREAVQLFEGDAVQKAQEGFSLIDTAYRAGKIGLLQLVVAQNDFVSAESSYLDSLWEYWVARIGLETAAGTDLEQVKAR